VLHAGLGMIVLEGNERVHLHRRVSPRRWIHGTFSRCIRFITSRDPRPFLPSSTLSSLFRSLPRFRRMRMPKLIRPSLRRDDLILGLKFPLDLSVSDPVRGPYIFGYYRATPLSPR